MATRGISVDIQATKWLVLLLEATFFDSDRVDTGQPFLYGRVNFGDSVEDEWLIVYILRELSSQFPSLWIRVADTDGEFLLVEAANVLPQWLNPDIADNRVSYLDSLRCYYLTDSC